MGFWDFIAPDYDGFKELVSPWMPANLIVGPVVLDRDNLADIAYVNPASLSGLVARVAYSMRGDAQATPESSWNACQALADNLNRGGMYTPSPAFAGSDLTIGNAVAPLVIPNCYEITVRMISGTRPIANVFFAYSTTAGAELTVANAFLTAWKSNAASPLKLLTVNTSMTMVQCTDIRSLTGGQAQVPDTTAGTVNSHTATRAACALLQFNGGSRNRSTRGRTYFGPLGEGQIQQDGATLETAYQTAVVAAFNYLNTQMTAAGFPLVVASRKLLMTTPWTNIRVSPTVATQRHRLRA